MCDNSVEISDAKRRLNEKLGVVCEQTKLLQARPFSNIFQLSCDGDDSEFILKVSRTNRACSNEFHYYNLLLKNNLLTIEPIIFSEKYNYIVTVKKNISNFEDLIKENVDISQIFRRLGAYIQALDTITEESSFFNGEKFLSYVSERVNLIKCFQTGEKQAIFLKINSLLSDIAAAPSVLTLYSDMSLSNLHVDENGEVLILDMGDAYLDNIYSKISDLYLNLRYCSLNRYYQREAVTNKYFSCFLDGYDGLELDDRLFTLYQIRHVLNMIRYMEKNAAGVGWLQLLHYKLLLFKLKRYLFQLLDDEYCCRF